MFFYLFPGDIVFRLFQGLGLDLLGDSILDALVFFHGNLFSDLSVGRVATENKGVEKGNTDHDAGHGEAKQTSKGISDRAQNHIEHKSPDRVEQKAKVDGNHDTEEFELGFEAADQQTTAYGVNGQDEARESWESNNNQDLYRLEYSVICHKKIGANK